MKVIEAIPRDRALLYVDPGATPACMGGHLDFGILIDCFIIIKIILLLCCYLCRFRFRECIYYLLLMNPLFD